MLRQFELSPLDEGEIDTGAEAWSAVLYENQVAFTAMTGALIWTASIGAPRVSEALELKKRKELEAEARRRLEAERSINPAPGRDTAIVSKAA